MNNSLSIQFFKELRGQHPWISRFLRQQDSDPYIQLEGVAWALNELIAANDVEKVAKVISSVAKFFEKGDRDFNSALRVSLFEGLDLDTINGQKVLLSLPENLRAEYAEAKKYLEG